MQHKVVRDDSWLELGDQLLEHQLGIAQAQCDEQLRCSFLPIWDHILYNRKNIFLDFFSTDPMTSTVNTPLYKPITTHPNYSFG